MYSSLQMGQGLPVDMRPSLMHVSRVCGTRWPYIHIKRLEKETTSNFEDQELILDQTLKYVSIRSKSEVPRYLHALNLIKQMFVYCVLVLLSVSDPGPFSPDPDQTFFFKSRSGSRLLKPGSGSSKKPECDPDLKHWFKSYLK